MARITITIITDNAAFEDDPYELERILVQVGKQIRWAKGRSGVDRRVKDINGNTVGHFETEDNTL